MKVALMLASVFFIFAAISSASSTDRSNKTSAQQVPANLANWSINQNGIGRKRNTSGHSDCAPRTPPLKSYWLTRPGALNYVSVIEIDSDGTVNLNPEGFDYGPIPELKSFTPLLADQLYGSPLNETKSGSKLQKEYRLSTRLFNGTSGKDVSLDLRFDNEQLKEYRVQNDEIHSNDWLSVL